MSSPDTQPPPRPAGARLRLSDLHPEVRAAFRFLPNPPVRGVLGRGLMRAAMALVPFPRLSGEVAYRRVPLEPPGVAVHLFTPTAGASGGALLWVHGGGLVVGAAHQDHATCAALTRSLGLVVASVDYRLAPEHPYPAALDDCAGAWRWLWGEAAACGVDPRRVAVGGQSAGGGLAAALALRLRDEGGPQPAAQWLFCPMLDDRTSLREELDGARHFLWDNRSNRAGWRAYLGAAYGSDAVPPHAAPARAKDLRGLPPAWLGVGDAELFYDEVAAYAGALRAAGVDVALDVVPGGPHGFESIAPRAPVTRAYLDRAHGWLAARIGRPPARASTG